MSKLQPTSITILSHLLQAHLFEQAHVPKMSHHHDIYVPEDWATQIMQIIQNQTGAGFLVFLQDGTILELSISQLQEASDASPSPSPNMPVEDTDDIAITVGELAQVLEDFKDYGKEDSVSQYEDRDVRR